MSLQSQKKNMKEISTLLSQDLGYIFGERESGPNGAKKKFLSKNAAFLRALGEDLGFTEFRVNTNRGGIAVSGEVSLYGMWSDGNGVFFEITQSCGFPNALLYREIRSMKDCCGRPNQWVSLDIFKNQDYKLLCSMLTKVKRTVYLDGVGRVA